MPTSVLARAQPLHARLVERSRTCSRSFRISRGVGGSDLRKASETRSEPSGRLSAPTSRRAAEAPTCMLPPPRSKNDAVLDGQPAAPRPGTRSAPPPGPSMMRTSDAQLAPDACE